MAPVPPPIELPTTTAPPVEETTTTTEPPPSTTEPEATTTTARLTTTTAQPVPTTEAPPSTLNDLLVPGPIDAATGEPVTTTTAVPIAAVQDEDNTGTIVALVISGLLVIALLIALLTWRYWRDTRPKVVAQRAMNKRTLR